MIIKKIPYGLTDFERIRKEPYYYVDKTHYIEWLGCGLLWFAV